MAKPAATPATMERHELLPGVTVRQSPPAVVCASAKVIRGARRRAALRDAINITLLGAIDWLVIHWPNTHVPLLDRHDSLELVALANVAVIAGLVVARALPRWRARRVAETWCTTERAALDGLIAARRSRHVRRG